MRHDRAAELTKRFRLQDELRELARPLYEALPADERQAIAERVRKGIIRQSLFPANGGHRGIVG